MSYILNLKGKTAVVTGAASGIGFECVKGYAENGADIYMIDYNEAENEKKAQEVRGLYPNVKVFTVTADMTKEELIRELVKARITEARLKKGYEVKGDGANKVFMPIDSKNTK